MTTTVHMNGNAYQGWETLTVSRSIDDAVSTAAFSSPLRWPDDPNPVRVRVGGLVQVFDDEDQMFYGNADAISIDSDPDGDIVAIDARSATADLSDCSVVTVPYAWKQKTMLEIASLIALPYGVNVIDLTLADEVIGRPIDFRVDLGEPVFDAIERMAQDAGVLVTDNGDGNIVLTKTRSVFGLLDEVIGLPTLEYGVNVTAARGVFRHDQRYREYRVYGQRPGSDTDSGATTSLQRVIVEDPEVERTRILALSANSQATLDQLKSRGVWEAVTRAGRSVALSYQVVGWRRPDGKLWAPGQLIKVKDRPRGIDAVMVVSAVSWSQNNETKAADISVAPPEGVELMATEQAAQDAPQKLSKTVTPGAKYAPWLTDAQVAAIAAKSGK